MSGEPIRFSTILLGVLVAAGSCASFGPGPQRPEPTPGVSLIVEADGLRRRGLLDQAEARYRAVLSEDAASVRAHIGLQTIGLRRGLDLDVRREYRAGDDPFLSGRLEPVGEPQREAFATANEPWRSFGLAAVAAAEGEYVEARRRYGDALTVDPGMAWALNGLGRAYLAGGRLGEAASAFRAAIWAEPDHPGAWIGMSVVEDRRGDLAGALRWALEAFRRAPTEESVWERAAALAGRSGRRDWFRKVASILSGERSERSPAGPLVRAGTLLARAGEGAAAEARWAEARAAGATEAEIVAARRPPLPREVRAFARSFVRGVTTRYRHYAATGEAETFEEFVAWARGLYERATGRKLAAPGEIVDFSFVGKQVDARAQSDEPLVRECARAGLLLILGQRRGGPPEAMLAEARRRELFGPVEVRGLRVEREVVWTGRRLVSGYQEWAGAGDLAGLALDRIILVDLDAIAIWEARVRERLRVMEGRRAQAAAAEALADEPVGSVADPAGVADRLYLAGPIDIAGEVLVHENAHLVDAALHLPVGKHLLRNVGLLFKRGFKAVRIVALLERNAQLTAIAEGPTPLASLASCCAALDHRGPHGIGYTEIVRGFVREILRSPERYPEIDPERVVVQQLHRLSAGQVRAIAVRLMERWSVSQ